jgi:ACS family glucarate transporter-like MFS transporter
MKLFRPTGIVLLMLCLMYLITYIDRVNVSTASVGPLGFGKEFNLSKTQIGLVFSAFAYPYLIFQIIGGWVSDQFGTRRTLIVCSLVWATATVLTGLAGGLTSLIIARVLLGLGEGATFPAATSAMSRWVKPADRGFAQGITHSAARLGNALAPGLIVGVMAIYGWRASFFVCAGISFVWVIVWFFVFRENPKDHPGMTLEECAVLPPPKAKGQPVPWGPLVARMAPVTIVYFCYGWTLWLFLSWIPQYFQHQGQDLKKMALFSSGVFLAGVVGDTLGGIVTDRIYAATGNLDRARSLMVSVCMGLTCLSLLPMMFSHNLMISAISLSAGFFFAEMTIGPMWAVPMDIAPEHSGTASGIMNTGSAFAAIVSPVVGGWLIDRTGDWQLPFLGSIVLMVVGMGLAFTMRPAKRLTQAS